MRVVNQADNRPLQSQDRQNAITEIGRIACGITDQSNPQKPRPKSVEYFVPRGNFADTFTSRYGPEPTKLEILFYSDDENFSCSERMEIRDKSGRLYGFGDGETFHFYNEKTKKYTVTKTLTEKPTLLADTVTYLTQGMDNYKAQNIKWKQLLYLRFMLKDFPALGYWQFVTGGVNSSIPAIRDTFDSFLQTFGTVRCVPFMLTVKKIKSDKPGNSDQFSLVKLTPMISFEQGYHLAQLRSENPTANPFTILDQVTGRAFLNAAQDDEPAWAAISSSGHDEKDAPIPTLETE